jgi:hypothetical protein
MLNICDVFYVFLYFPGYRQKLLLLGYGLSSVPTCADFEFFSSSGQMQAYLNANDIFLTASEVQKELYGEIFSNETKINYYSDGDFNYMEIIEEYGDLDIKSCLKMLTCQRHIYKALLKK